MRSELLEYWGESLIAAARVQKQGDLMMQWVSRWHTGLCEAMLPWTGAAPRDGASAFRGPDRYQAYGETGEISRRILSGYLKLFGVVPMDEFADLARRYEELKARCTAQEEALKHFSWLLQGQGGMGGSDVILKQFQDLAARQKENYQKLVEGFIDFFDASK
jgi:hypothetical protein